MSRLLRALMISLAVASCGGGGDKSAPADLDNACRILDQRPEYKRAFRATKRKYGVPVSVQMAIIHQESKFDGDARTPHQYALGIIPIGRQSSAYGYSQALDGTWEEYVSQEGRRRARRDDIYDATDFIGWYMTQTRDELGIPLSNARDQYLAYHEGRGGYAKGSHYSKDWLMSVANKVQLRADMYRAQLISCSDL